MESSCSWKMAFNLKYWLQERNLNINTLFRDYYTNYYYYYLNKFIYFIILFYYFIFLAALGLHCCAWAFLWLRGAGATLRCNVRASRCSGFSCCRAWALGVQPSVVVAHRLSNCGSWALECRLSSCGAWAQLLCGMWDLPGPGIKPVSPALAGGFLTTAPPGKPPIIIF